MSVFLSDLSVDELLLVEQSGWEPVDIVSGECSQATPTLGRSSSYLTRELINVTRALSAGPHRALERMRQRVKAAGADGAVGVRLSWVDHELRGGVARHYTAIGTAVRERGAPRRERVPFSSHLSGQDTWALHAAGRRPLGVALGVSVHNVGMPRVKLRAVAEVPEVTAAIYAARELAMSRMQEQAAALSARGVVGVEVTMKLLPGPVVLFEALGTAIGGARPGRAAGGAVGVSLGGRRSS